MTTRDSWRRAWVRQIFSRSLSSGWKGHGHLAFWAEKPGFQKGIGLKVLALSQIDCLTISAVASRTQLSGLFSFSSCQCNQGYSLAWMFATDWGVWREGPLEKGKNLTNTHMMNLGGESHHMGCTTGCGQSDCSPTEDTTDFTWPAERQGRSQPSHTKTCMWWCNVLVVTYPPCHYCRPWVGGNTHSKTLKKILTHFCFSKSFLEDLEFSTFYHFS